MVTHAFSFLFPVLSVTWGVQWLLEHFAKRWSPGTRAFFALVTALICVAIPLEGLPLARWLTSVNANFSIPLTALVFDRIWERSVGYPLMDEKARKAAGLFGLGAGVLLYPMALGLGGFDPYGLGFGSAWLLLPLLLITLFLLHGRNRFGAVLVASVLAYNLRLLESSNLWDYLLDPLFVVSAAIHHSTSWKEKIRTR
jgi:hypothetical protein